MLTKITSPHNSLIKEISKLANKYDRYMQQRFIAEGIRTCSTIIAAGNKPLYCFATEPMLDRAAALIPESDPIVVSPAILNKISQTTTPSGLVCVFEIPKKQTQIPQQGLVLVNITDPGNMGALFRTCASIDKRCVIVVNGVDPYHPKVVQSSAGTIGLLSIVSISWNQLVEQARANNTSLCALMVRGGTTYENISFEKTLLIVGNEAHGISDQEVAECDQKLTIAMPGPVESLNVSAAGSIALYLAWGLHSK